MKDTSTPADGAEQKIDKIELQDYSTWQTLYIKGDKDTIALILAFVAQLNNPKS